MHVIFVGELISSKGPFSCTDSEGMVEEMLSSGFFVRFIFIPRRLLILFSSFFPILRRLASIIVARKLKNARRRRLPNLRVIRVI